MTKRDASKLSKQEQRADAQELDSSQPAFPVHEHIGRQLKAIFDEVTTQPVPENIRRLLEELEDKS